MLSEASLFVVQGALQQATIWSSVKRLEDVHAAAGEQRGDDFEGRILGGGADQSNVAFLHVRKERILLGLVEAVDFVDEHNRAGAVLLGALGVGHHLLDFLDAGQHGGELDELGLGHAGDDLRQGGLAGTGRAPEDQRADVIALDLDAQRFAWPDESAPDR